MQEEKDFSNMMLVEHILEVRHYASGKFLDVRGYVADYIRSTELFPHWQIDENTINFRDDPKQIIRDGAFASYKAAGYVVYNPQTKNYFVDKASSYWKKLTKNQHYNLPDPTRFGARTKVFIPVNKPFDEIHSLVFDTFYNPLTKELVGDTINDIQFTFNLNANDFNIKISGGPVHSNEVAKYMSFNADEFKSEGIYLDLDYSKVTNLDNKDITKFLKSAIESTWQKIDNITSKLGV